MQSVGRLEGERSQDTIAFSGAGCAIFLSAPDKCHNTVVAYLEELTVDESKPQPNQAILEPVKRVQGGDTDACTELLNALHGPVLGYVYHMLHDRQAAEDVAQDPFMRAHDRRGQLGPPYDFKSWVFRIANKLAIDYTRAGVRFVDVEDGVMFYLDEKAQQAPTKADCQGSALSGSATGLQSGRYGCYLTDKGRVGWLHVASVATAGMNIDSMSYK